MKKIVPAPYIDPDCPLGEWLREHQQRDAAAGCGHSH